MQIYLNTNYQRNQQPKKQQENIDRKEAWQQQN